MGTHSDHVAVYEQGLAREAARFHDVMAESAAGKLRFSRTAIEAEWAARLLVFALETLAEARAAQRNDGSCGCRFCTRSEDAGRKLFLREWPEREGRVKAADPSLGNAQDRSALSAPLFLAWKAEGRVAASAQLELVSRADELGAVSP